MFREQRRKRGSVKMLTVHHCFLLGSRLRTQLCTEFPCGHLHFTFTLLPPAPPPLMFVFAPVFVTCVGCAVGFGSTLLFIFHSVCSLWQECCMKEAPPPQFWSHKTQLWHHLYFPYALNTEIRNHLKLMKLSSVPLLVFPNCQQPSWTLHTGLIITQLCVKSKTSLSPSSSSPCVHTWL